MPENLGFALLRLLQLGTISTLAKLDDDSVRKMFVSPLRHVVMDSTQQETDDRAKWVFVLERRKRLISLLIEAAFQVLEEVDKAIKG